MTIEVKTMLPDWPAPAPNPSLTLTWPDCERPLDEVPPECLVSGNLERGIRYMTRQQVNAHQQPQQPDRSETLEPETPYITLMSMKVPRAVPMDQIKMCTVVPLGHVRQCAPMGTLPRAAN